MSAEGLPAGWLQHIDPATNNPYYQNLATNEVTWTRPAAVSTEANGQAQAQAQAQAQLQQQMQLAGQQQQIGQQQMQLAGQPQMAGQPQLAGQPQAQMGAQAQMQAAQLQALQAQQSQLQQQPQLSLLQNVGNLQALLQTAQQPGAAGGAPNNFDIAALIQNASQQAVLQQQALAANPVYSAALAAATANLGQVAPAAQAERKEGKVKNWNDEKGYGFIDPVEGGENVFVHRSSLSDGLALVPGTTVQFHLEFDHGKGKTRAKAVTGCVEGKGGGPNQQAGSGPGGLAPPSGDAPAGGDIRTGSTKSWFEEKGFGFVTLSTGEDCYVHRTNLSDGHSLEVGSPVTLTVEWDSQRNKYKCTTLLGAAQGKGGSGGQQDGAQADTGKDNFADFGKTDSYKSSPY